MAGRGFLEAWEHVSWSTGSSLAEDSRSSNIPCRRARWVRHCIDTREDEHSHVLVGRVGALLGDDVLVSGPGDLIFKPRNQWHTFWNADDEPARILEIRISPAGFEKYFCGSSSNWADRGTHLQKRYEPLVSGMGSKWIRKASRSFFNGSTCASANRFDAALERCDWTQRRDRET